MSETVEPSVVRAAAGEAISRREFGAAVAIASLSRRPVRRSFSEGGSVGEGGLLQSSAVTFGVQSYSFRDRSLADAIAGMQKLGLRSCELWQNHVEPLKIPREDLRRWRETVRATASLRSARPADPAKFNSSKCTKPESK